MSEISKRGWRTEGAGARKSLPYCTVDSGLFSDPIFPIGQKTEQVRTGQVNPDRPLVGSSVDHLRGIFRGESLKG